MSRKLKFSTLYDALFARVNKNTPTSCWEWTGCKSNQYGHGGFTWNRKHYYSHRVSWELVNGNIPKDKIVCHKCDNPRCCNPDHLYLGTQKSNLNDASKRERIGKISLKTASQIQKLYSLGHKTNDIAKTLGFTPRQVRGLKKRKNTFPEKVKLPKLKKHRTVYKRKLPHKEFLLVLEAIKSGERLSYIAEAYPELSISYLTHIKNGTNPGYTLESLIEKTKKDIKANPDHNHYVLRNMRKKEGYRSKYRNIYAMRLCDVVAITGKNHLIIAEKTKTLEGQNEILWLLKEKNG